MSAKNDFNLYQYRNILSILRRILFIKSKKMLIFIRFLKYM